MQHQSPCAVPIAVTDAQAIAATKTWIERAVIGLSLCPFARVPFNGHRVRFRVSAATGAAQLAADLREEAGLLVASDPTAIETTLLIHPHAFAEFIDYNDFLEVADALLVEMDLDGTVQVASFHPHYRFADAADDAVENCTNRSPFPTLHLLREASITHAVDSVPDGDAIWQRNIETLRALGHQRWRELWDETSSG